MLIRYGENSNGHISTPRLIQGLDDATHQIAEVVTLLMDSGYSVDELFADDIHPNALGHDVVARALAFELVRLKVVPRSLSWAKAHGVWPPRESRPLMGEQVSRN